MILREIELATVGSALFISVDIQHFLGQTAGLDQEKMLVHHYNNSEDIRHSRYNCYRSCPIELLEWHWRSERCDIYSVITKWLFNYCLLYTASLLPAACFIGVSFAGCDRIAAVVLMTLGTMFMSAMNCGILVNHIDIASNYAGTLFALTVNSRILNAREWRVSLYRFKFNYLLKTYRIPSLLFRDLSCQLSSENLLITM